MLRYVLCFVVYTCFVFDCISAVLRDRCWLCCSVMTATIINEDYYYYYYYVVVVIS